MREIYRIITGTKNIKKELGDKFIFLKDCLDDIRKDAAIDEYVANGEPVNYKIINRIPSNNVFVYQPNRDEDIVYTCDVNFFKTKLGLVTGKNWRGCYVDNENWEEEMLEILRKENVDCIRVEPDVRRYKMDYAIEMHTRVLELYYFVENRNLSNNKL